MQDVVFKSFSIYFELLRFIGETHTRTYLEWNTSNSELYTYYFLFLRSDKLMSEENKHIFCQTQIFLYDKIYCCTNLF